LFENHINKFNITVTEDDVFLYGSVGGNDLGVIAASDSLGQQSLIGDYINTHLNNIQRLYNNGCRQLIFLYIDSETVRVYKISLHLSKQK